jgi:hypothetical protein
MAALKVSTAALASGSPTDDSTYNHLSADITDWTTSRDALATQIKGLLDSSAFGGKALNERDARSLTQQAQALIAQVVGAAG